jgi:hypothetical protein
MTSNGKAFILNFMELNQVVQMFERADMGAAEVHILLLRSRSLGQTSVLRLHVSPVVLRMTAVSCF